ncbi:MAG: electron transport complex subunit RsxE [Nitrospirae bacterium]|nr:electron transport complex subunit RsxE [Nitrospirota bacterium]
MDEKQPNLYNLIKNGIFSENPVFKLALSLCPAVAVTTTVKNGFLMGVAVLFVMTMVNITVSIFKDFINPKVRIPAYILIIALYVSMTDMVMAAYARSAYKEMGLYIQLIVVFAIIISRAELFASKNKVIPSAVDGIGMGLGFLFALVLVGAVRELIGKGSLLGYSIFGGDAVLIMVLPTGGFFAIGLLMGLFNWIEDRYFGGMSSPGGGHGH